MTSAIERAIEEIKLEVLMLLSLDCDDDEEVDNNMIRCSALSDAVKILEKHKKSSWIPVEERLPELVEQKIDEYSDFVTVELEFGMIQTMRLYKTNGMARHLVEQGLEIAWQGHDGDRHFLMEIDKVKRWTPIPKLPPAPGEDSK